MFGPTSQYLLPATFVDSDHPQVISYAKEISQPFSQSKEQLIALYYAVRDGFRYDPYRLNLTKEALKASHLLQRNYGYCIEKSCLFVACARVLGIPARLGFARVRNHIGTEKLEAILKTNVLVFHGYAEVWLHDRWIKATPVFNKELCERLNVAPLEFDGTSDAVFQAYDQHGGRFMEYLHDYGTFEDVPYEYFISELQRFYPHLSKEFQSGIFTLY